LLLIYNIFAVNREIQLFATNCKNSAKQILLLGGLQLPYLLSTNLFAAIIWNRAVQDINKWEDRKKDKKVLLVKSARSNLKLNFGFKMRQK
jgi:hypothetical protein